VILLLAAFSCYHKMPFPLVTVENAAILLMTNPPFTHVLVLKINLWHTRAGKYMGMVLIMHVHGTDLFQKLGRK
jgi:hypothetical protein